MLPKMRRNPLRIKPLDDRLKKTHSSKRTKPTNQDKEKHEQHTHTTPNRPTPTRETEYPTIVEDPQMVLVSISRLPSDVLLDILTRLSIKTLSICRYVCRSWRYIIRSPRFTKMHHNKAHQRGTHITSLILHHDSVIPDIRSDLYLLECENDDSFSDDGVDVVKAMILNTQFNRMNLEFEVVGSCNGLLCLSEPLYYDPVYVCNPVTGEYMTLPLASERTNFDIVSGFGFDCAKNEYKVVRMLYHWINYSNDSGQKFKLEGEVYTIGSGRWRRIGDVPYPLCGKFVPAFVNGALHWLLDSHGFMDVYELIVGFDVESEEFRVLPAPPDYRRGQAYVNFRLHLRVLGGQLSLLDSTPDDHIVIWVMKEYGVEGSWKKEYVVEPPLIGLERPYVSPLGLMKNEEILFSCNGRTLIQYDPVEKRFRALRIQGLPPYFSAFNHVGSLVSLRDAGETMSGWRGSGSYGRWSTTLRPVPSHDPKINMELLFSQRGLYQVADPEQAGMIMFLPRDCR